MSEQRKIKQNIPEVTYFQEHVNLRDWSRRSFPFSGGAKGMNNWPGPPGWFPLENSHSPLIDASPIPTRRVSYFAPPPPNYYKGSYGMIYMGGQAKRRHQQYVCARPASGFVGSSWRGVPLVHLFLSSRIP